MNEIKKPNFFDSFEIVDLEEKLEFCNFGQCGCGNNIGGCGCDGACNNNVGCGCQGACADVRCYDRELHRIEMLR